MPVYIIGVSIGYHHYTKIGIAVSVKKRMQGIQTSVPVKLDVGWEINPLWQCIVREKDKNCGWAESIIDNEVYPVDLEKCYGSYAFLQKPEQERTIEEQLHRLYRNYRASGEWFNLRAKTVMEIFTKSNFGKYETDMLILRSLENGRVDIGYDFIMEHKFSIKPIDFSKKGEN